MSSVVTVPNAPDSHSPERVQNYYLTEVSSYSSRSSGCVQRLFTLSLVFLEECTVIPRDVGQRLRGTPVTWRGNGRDIPHALRGVPEGSDRCCRALFRNGQRKPCDFPGDIRGLPWRTSAIWRGKLRDIARHVGEHPGGTPTASSGMFRGIASEPCGSDGGLCGLQLWYLALGVGLRAACR